MRPVEVMFGGRPRRSVPVIFEGTIPVALETRRSSSASSVAARARPSMELVLQSLKLPLPLLLLLFVEQCRDVVVQAGQLCLDLGANVHSNLMEHFHVFDEYWSDGLSLLVCELHVVN